MKKTLLVLTLGILGIGMGMAQNLDVKVKGIEEVEGNIRIAVFNQSKEFPDDEFAYQKKEVPVTGESQTIRFSNLPRGTYSVAIYHDEDRNRELNTNFFGMPTEDYGFSNNASGTFGPPSFESCSFSFNGSSKTISIEID